MTSFSFSSKFLDMFRNLKTDAVPRSPRKPPHTEEHVNYQVEEEDDAHDGNEDTTNEPDEILVESGDDDDIKKEEKKSKFKNTFFKSNKKNNKHSFPKMDKNEKKNGASSVNTQATGNVINIVNASNIRFGSDYYMGAVNRPSQKEGWKEDEDHENPIQKNNLITLLLESKIKAEHEYLDYIAKNLGKNWRTFFRNMGYTKGRIETIEIETVSYGVSEARYKLLIDWANNADDATLGRLASRLWKEGEREIVKELAIIYKNNVK